MACPKPGFDTGAGGEATPVESTERMFLTRLKPRLLREREAVQQDDPNPTETLYCSALGRIDQRPVSGDDREH